MFSNIIYIFLFSVLHSVLCYYTVGASVPNYTRQCICFSITKVEIPYINSIYTALNYNTYYSRAKSAYRRQAWDVKSTFLWLILLIYHIYAIYPLFDRIFVFSFSTSLRFWMKTILIGSESKEICDWYRLCVF